MFADAFHQLSRKYIQNILIGNRCHFGEDVHRDSLHDGEMWDAREVISDVFVKKRKMKGRKNGLDESSKVDARVIGINRVTP